MSKLNLHRKCQGAKSFRNIEVCYQLCCNPLFFASLALHEPQTTTDCFRNLYSLRRIISRPRGKVELQRVCGFTYAMCFFTSAQTVFCSNVKRFVPVKMSLLPYLYLIKCLMIVSNDHNNSKKERSKLSVSHFSGTHAAVPQLSNEEEKIGKCERIYQKSQL